MENFGETILRLRKEQELSQELLARALQVSQATVSRIESSAESPSDVRLIAKLAKSLRVPLVELLPEELRQEGDGNRSFYAFCPNPLCGANETYLDAQGRPQVSWDSGKHYQGVPFEEVNFCEFCGEGLVKECPSCKKPMTKFAKYCLRCGERMYPALTPTQWKEVQECLEDRGGMDDAGPDRTPDDEIPF